MTFDTGSSVSTLPGQMLHDLGLVEVGARRLPTPGGPAILRVTSIPRLFLGDLMIERLPVGGVTMPAEFSDQGVLGTAVVQAAPWEISWDRGTITFNAPVWPGENGISSVHLFPISGGRPTVDVRLNGSPIRMIVDTGGVFSMISRNDARRIGLPIMSVDATGFKAIGGTIPATGRILAGDLEIGSLVLKGQLFVENTGAEPNVLGLPALASFDLQIDPSGRLLLKPRNPDMRATAASRVARWPWMPSCHAIGCVRGYVEGSGESGRVIFEFEAMPPRPVSILFGCAEGTEPDWLLPSELRQRTKPPYRHIRLNLNPRPTNSISAMMRDIEKMMVLSNGKVCHELTVLDVYPLREFERPDRSRVWFLP